MKNILLALWLALLWPTLQGQKSYWVVFSNKGSAHSTVHEDYDLPLSTEYTETLKKHCRRILGESRWANALALQASDAQIEKIRQYDFVREILPISRGHYPSGASQQSYTKNKSADSHQRLELVAQHQLSRLQGQAFQEVGWTGKGVRIAVLDGGFPGVDKHPAFDHMRHRIVGTYDFVKKKPFVYRGNSHGTAVLSNLVGRMGDLPLGLAPDAEILLAITEVGGEPFWEEVSWVQALEWAYDQGARLVSSSLGYGRHRYFPEEMNGQVSLIARHANIAAARGVLIVNAMGNEGQSRSGWPMMITPADADSVLSVGAIDLLSEISIDFSSLGPTTDGRRKPNVSADGQCVVALPSGDFGIASGTSFSTPLIAGFAACVWQGLPDHSAMEILQALEVSAELYPYFDYAHGYGVPDARFFTRKTSPIPPTFSFENDGESLSVHIADTLPLPLGKSHLIRLFYKYENEEHRITSYAVINVFQKKALSIPLRELQKQKFVTVHFLGYTSTYEMP